MTDWIKKIQQDIRRGSLAQLLVTAPLIIFVTGYEVTRNIAPITTSAILYWEGGFTTEEFERSQLHNLCDNMDDWPMSLFVKKDDVIQDKCNVLKRRHMLRNAEDWALYHNRIKRLKEQPEPLPGNTPKKEPRLVGVIHKEVEYEEDILLPVDDITPPP